MPRPKKPCANPDCNNLTNGALCRPCSSIVRRTSGLEQAEYRRQWNMLRKYGIDLEGFDVLWVAFRGKCGICGNDLKMPALGQGQMMDVVAIDHCHTTGNIRGLLCNACNKGLGMFRDNIEILKRAIKWLEK